MRRIKQCPLCGKPLIEVSSIPFGDVSLVDYKCGHSFTTNVINIDESQLDFTSASGSKVARNYQRDGIEFIIKSNFNCIIGDQMRLGKTPQALLALKNRYAERTPCLIIVKSANVWQWVREYREWASTLPLGVMVIEGSKKFIMPGFDAYIISMGSLSRGSRVTELLEFGFKLVIVDEAHSFKNSDSKRSQALIQFLKQISVKEIERVILLNCTLCHHSWKETTKVTLNLRSSHKMAEARHNSICPSCGAHTAIITRKDEMDLRDNGCGCVMLTGTPIKNRADEFFVPLNIVAPEKFPSLTNFQRTWLEKNDKGAYARVTPWYLDQFKETIKLFYLRREKEDVYTDLPELNRMFTVIEIEDERLRKAYNTVLDRLQIQMEEKKNFTFFDSLADLNILRQICGISKVDWASDYLEASLLDNSTKYAVGIHHHDVRDLLAYRAAALGVMKLSGEDSAEQKDRVMRLFETAPERVLVINTLAGGVGMDFHYIDNALILERQWSSADEEQFEFRFYNPDKSIKDRPTNIEYLVAKGTIDEWFYDLVESKRQIFGETIGTNWSLQQDESSFKDLLERTVANRL